MQQTYIKQALKLAQKAFAKDEVPVGAVIVDSKTGEVIATGFNRTEEKNDPCAHAEIEVIKQACKKSGSTRIPDCDLYVTLEPCPMCAQAISFARIRRLYFGAYDPKGGGVENGAKIFNASSCHHKPEVYGGISERECGDLLKEFFALRRN